MQGRGQDADRIIADARALEDASAFAIVIEGVPPDVAARVTDTVSIPTIGIGAGAHCDGQVLVSTDLLGLSQGPSPKFVKRFAELGAAVKDAVGEYARQVRSGEFPSIEQTYKPNAVAAESGETLNVVPLSSARR
jgi:3-methyl-2-oxobutanoate hydroxymethyltransferase